VVVPSSGYAEVDRTLKNIKTGVFIWQVAVPVAVYSKPSGKPLFSILLDERVPCVWSAMTISMHVLIVLVILLH